MRLRILTALLMVIGFTSAYAQSSSTSTSTSGTSATQNIAPAGNVGTSTSTSSTQSSAGSTGNAMQGTLNYSVTGGSVPEEQYIHQYIERGGNDTTNINQKFSGTYSIRNVPNVVAPNILPTSPCMGSSSAGAGWTGFGVSLGSSWKDADCGIRETARVFFQANMAADGLAVLCASEYASTAPACRAIKKAEEQSGPITASATIDKVVKQPGTYDITPKGTAIREGNDTYRNLDKGGNFNKTSLDSAFTQAAMQPTEWERRQANCEIARKMGDDLLGARFGCPKQ